MENDLVSETIVDDSPVIGNGVAARFCQREFPNLRHGADQGAAGAEDDLAPLVDGLTDGLAVFGRDLFLAV